MKSRKLLRNKAVLWLFLGFFIIYLYFLINFKEYDNVWWDGASYIGMGKYLFSHGSQGVFEFIKPILLPVFLGIFWKLGFNAVIAGKLFIFLVSFLTLTFLYLSAKEIFNKKAGIIASIILFLNPLFFLFMYRIYTEMMSVCFILGSVFFMIKFSKQDKNYFLVLSALFCALAFFSKYPNILLALILNLFLLSICYKKRKISYLFWFNIILLAFLLPFLILNYIYTGDALYLVNAGQEYYKENLGVLYSFKTFPGIPKLFFENTDLLYFKSIFYLFNILLPFMLLGAYYIVKEKKDENYSAKIFLIILPALIFFCFFEIFYLKQERYLLPIFPMLAIFVAYSLSKINQKVIFVVILVYALFGLCWAIGANYFYNFDERAYANFFTNPPINFSCEKAATCDPHSALSLLNKKITFPYEVFDETWKPERAPAVIIKENPDCVFYFSCAQNKSQHTKELQNLGYSVAYSRGERCIYAVFKK